MSRSVPARLRRVPWIVASLAIIGSAVTPVAAEETLPEGVFDQSFALPGGERVLQLAAVVEAPVAKAWAAFATEEGFRAWAVPLAKIDLRVGGSIESSYDPKVPLGSGRTIRNEIVALVPERLLVLRNVQAPPGVPFDVAIFQAMQTALWFEPVDGGRTRITLVNGRFLEGPAYEGVYRFFHTGNSYSLGQLRRHLAPAAAPVLPSGAKDGAEAALRAPGHPQQP